MTKSEFVHLEVPALYKYLHVVAACVAAVLERASVGDDRELFTYNVVLAIHETCTNIIEHAYRGQDGRIQVRIALGETPYRLTVDLLDSGEAFDWAEVEPPDLNVPQEGNYGLFLATSLMDDVIYQREGHTNHWRLAKQI